MRQWKTGNQNIKMPKPQKNKLPSGGVVLTPELMEHLFVERMLNMKIMPNTPLKHIIYKLCKKIEELEKKANNPLIQVSSGTKKGKVKLGCEYVVDKK